MRPIKFRAWSTSMDYGLVLSEDGKPLWLRNGELEYEDTNAFVMQFTGLTDKNGKEIYEGDILTEGLLNPIQHGTKNFIVAHIQGAFCIQLPDFTCYGLYNYCHSENDKNKVSELYVIGNAYENPELINK